MFGRLNKLVVSNENYKRLEDELYHLSANNALVGLNDVDPVEHKTLLDSAIEARAYSNANLLESYDAKTYVELQGENLTLSSSPSSSETSNDINPLDTIEIPTFKPVSFKTKKQMTRGHHKAFNDSASNQPRDNNDETIIEPATKKSRHSNNVEDIANKTHESDRRADKNNYPTTALGVLHLFYGKKPTYSANEIASVAKLLAQQSNDKTEPLAWRPNLNFRQQYNPSMPSEKLDSALSPWKRK